MRDLITVLWYSLPMTEQTPITKTKRGRKPVGESAMTPAERQRRRRELLRTEGDKHYLLRLNELHQEHVEMIAKAEGMSGTKVLQTYVEVCLDRYIGIVQRCERLKEMGASDADVEAFMKTYFLPSLPSIEELEHPRPDSNRGTDNNTGVSSSR